MLEAFDIIELYCNRLIEHAKQLDKPKYASSLHLTSEFILFSYLPLLFQPLLRLHDYSVQTQSRV